MLEYPQILKKKMGDKINDKLLTEMFSPISEEDYFLILNFSEVRLLFIHVNGFKIFFPKFIEISIYHSYLLGVKLLMMYIIYDFYWFITN